MNASFFLPTKVFFGRNSVPENAGALALGKHAFLVTGKHGAKCSGALDDVTQALRTLGIACTLFDRISENPPLDICFSGGAEARAAGADFVIGIGGGSALDAAKAIAAYAANPGLSPMEIYEDEKRKNRVLPLAAVPTTAGTGSEVNPYSVMTLPDGVHKKTFKAADTWFTVAFVDPRYTESMNNETTFSTALDAFAHATESYLSPKTTVFSERAALFAAEKIWNVLSQYPEHFTPEMRDDLSVAATAAGMAISVTGTGFPHPLGYSITLLDGIPHGRACAVFAGDYLTYNEKTEQGRTRIAEFAAAIGTTPKVMKTYLPALADVDLSLTEEEMDRRIKLIANAKNYVNSPYVLSIGEIYEIYRRHFLKK